MNGKGNILVDAEIFEGRVETRKLNNSYSDMNPNSEMKVYREVRE